MEVYKALQTLEEKDEFIRLLYEYRMNGAAMDSAKPMVKLACKAFAYSIDKQRDKYEEKEERKKEWKRKKNNTETQDVMTFDDFRINLKPQLPAYLDKSVREKILMMLQRFGEAPTEDKLDKMGEWICQSMKDERKCKEITDLIILNN